MRHKLLLQARDVSLGTRPSSDFEDPRLNGKLNKVDFESILQLAVLCVAKLGKNRPDIDVVYDEMDRIWQKVYAEMVLSLKIHLHLHTFSIHFCDVRGMILRLV